MPYRILFCLLAACMIGVAAPYVFGQVKPTGTFGLRTPETLASHTNWLAANEFAAKCVISTGVILLAVAGVLPGVKRLTPLAYALTCFSTLLAGSIAGSVATAAFVHVLPVHHLLREPPLPKWDIACVFIVVGIIIAGVSAPFLLHVIPPNAYFGFRTQETLDDNMIWYRTNEYCGRLLFGTGCATAVVAFGLAPMPQIDPLSYYVVCATIFLAGTTFSTILGWDYMKTISGR